jgi:hypothetical protein
MWIPVQVMAMLEAFVHDPLINWRLLNTATDQPPRPATTTGGAAGSAAAAGAEHTPTRGGGGEGDGDELTTPVGCVGSGGGTAGAPGGTATGRSSAQVRCKSPPSLFFSLRVACGRQAFEPNGRGRLRETLRWRWLA